MTMINDDDDDDVDTCVNMSVKAFSARIIHSYVRSTYRCVCL